MNKTPGRKLTDTQVLVARTEAAARRDAELQIMRARTVLRTVPSSAARAREWNVDPSTVHQAVRGTHYKDLLRSDLDTAFLNMTGRP